MAEQVHKQHSKKEDYEDLAPESVSKSDVNVDDILDEIDDVLEVNAEEFVSQFVQKGGE